MHLLTSINPRMIRGFKGADVSQPYQSECIRSWLVSGFSISSLNGTDEVDLVRERFPDIEVIPVPDHRAKIVDFLAAATRHVVAGIVNSDCLFTGDAGVARQIEDAARRGMLLMQRTNLEPETLETAICCSGFDGFFFNTNVLRRVSMNEDLRIGDSWWDYILPLSYREAGGKLFQSSPFLLHLNHPLAWDEANYERGGQITKKMFSGKQGFRALSDEDSVGRFAGDVIRMLREVSEPINLRGNSIAAQMMDQVAWNLHASNEPKYIEPVNLDEIARQAVERYRSSRPSSRMLGESFCTAAVVLRTLLPQEPPGTCTVHRWRRPTIPALRSRPVQQRPTALMRLLSSPVRSIKVPIPTLDSPSRSRDNRVTNSTN